MFIERDGTKIELTENECKLAFEEYVNEIIKSQARCALIEYLYINTEEGTYIGGNLDEDFADEYGCTFKEMIDENSEHYVINDIIEEFKLKNDCYNHFSYDDNGWRDACEIIIG